MRKICGLGTVSSFNEFNEIEAVGLVGVTVIAYIFNK